MHEPTGHLEEKWTQVEGLSMHFRIGVDPLPAGHAVNYNSPVQLVREVRTFMAES